MLSVCIIVKNQEQNIARCLECLKPYGFELVVVDTGSKDRTKESALRYTHCVYDFKWTDDFAAAKNFAISKASHPYVMIIDSDEFVEFLQLEQLYQLISDHPQEVGRICRKNVFYRNGLKQENKEWINRIFFRDKFEYQGRIHEQVTGIEREDYDTYQAPVIIMHTGYDLTPEQRIQKSMRNSVLLERELADLEKNQQDEQIPYILYQLGKSFYMAEDYIRACEYFTKALSYDLNPKQEYVIDMVETYGYALLNSEQAETALFFENIYQEFGNSADFKFLMGLIYMNNARFEQAVEEFLKAVQYQECRNKGVNSYSAYYNVGVIYECLGKIEEAIYYYEKSDNYKPAYARLEACRKELSGKEKKIDK